MNNIIKRQIAIQRLLAESMLKGGIIPPHHMLVTVGDKYKTIQDMQHFLNQEIDELLIELGDGTRNIHKPWKAECTNIRGELFESTDNIKSEAIDILCFALNICIAAGINENNINDEYDKVRDKILGRIDNES